MEALNPGHASLGVQEAFASPAVGQQGWYIGMDIGPSLAPEAGLFVSDNDWSIQVAPH